MTCAQREAIPCLRTPLCGTKHQGGWANGDAVFVGENPPDTAVITYYQRSRHLFGKIKIEVLDAAGRVVDELPASKR
jgi:hypothetical protein